MKIVKLAVFALFFTPMAASSQEIANHALGLRLGDSDGFGAELSYQKSIFRYGRLEFDLGWRDGRNFDVLKFTGLYQTLFSIDGPFNWYYGFGGGLGDVTFEPGYTDDDGGLFVFAAGNIGVECNLNMPVLISLDLRPEIGVLGYDGFSDRFDFDIALGIRYQF